MLSKARVGETVGDRLPLISGSTEDAVIQKVSSVETISVRQLKLIFFSQLPNNYYCTHCTIHCTVDST